MVRHRCLGFRPAFTLIELVVSLGIMSILMAGLASALVVAARAMPAANDPADGVLDAGQVMDRMVSEIMFADSVTTAAPQEIVFTFRRQGVAHEVRYAWSGTPGAPLERQEDGGPAIAMTEGLETFSLDCDLVVPPAAGPRPTSKSAEQVFVAQDSSNSGPAADENIGSGDTIGIRFQPTLPADVTSWRVTRVQAILGPKSPKSGDILIGVREVAPGGEPAAVSLAEVSAFEADFVAGSWYEASLADAGGLTPGTP